VCRIGHFDVERRFPICRATIDELAARVARHPSGPVVSPQVIVGLPDAMRSAQAALTLVALVLVFGLRLGVLPVLAVSALLGIAWMAAV
jgi:hypothetical protein